MRCGITLFIQGYQDWDRYEAAEKGEDAPPIDPELDRKRFTEELDSALKLEDLGYDSIWTVEHHVSPYTMVTNPIQLLTYLAGATSRVDLGTMVTVVPWHHPVRIAEDISMLQYVLRGRQPFIGFGRGAARREFGQLGFDMNESKQRFAEGVEIIKLALTQERFSYDGEIHHFKDVTLRPRPLDPQTLIDNLCFSWGSPTSAPVGARLGLRPLVIPQKPWDQYHDDLAEFAKARAEVGLPAVNPKIHMCVYVGETEEQARENASRFIPEYADSATRNYETYSNHFATTKGYEHYASVARTVASKEVMSKAMGESYLANHVWGTPDQCVAKLRTIAEQFHPDEFMMVMRYGNMPQDVAEASTELFAREVLPAVHEMPVGEPIEYLAATG
jgi:alkanesulfonate monooxygenase SsuD/methylene tetrahydromethanopterin reductase-like flavin-dependent oxidoreductase (luciferase family)